MARVDMNQAAYRQLLSQIRDKIKRVDQRLRASHTGKPAGAIAPHARAALSRIGVTLPEAELLEYCQSIADDRDFKFKLS